MSEHEELADQIASRLAVRLGPPPERRLWDMQRMVGHRDIRSLMIYYNATAESMAKLP